MRGFLEIKHIENENISENDWKKIYKHFKNIPNGLEILVYHKDKILISNFSEFSSGEDCSFKDLYKYIEETNEKYEYQFKTIYLNGNNNNTNERRNRALVINRIDPVKIKNTNKPPITMILLSFLCIFEIFTISLVIYISKSIASSITFLESSTQKIAKGQLDIKLERARHGHKPNEITSLTENLEIMQKKLKESQDRRTMLIMGISHDLRTPVALIKGYSEAITDGILSDVDDIKKSMEIIYSKSEQLENLINDLINYVKLNETDWRKKLTMTNIYPILHDFAQNMIITGEIYKRKIITNIKISKNIKIPMDTNLFTRALENLFSNAIRYTSDNDEISLTAKEDKNKIELIISDTGRGISKKDLKHIFDLFYRASNSRQENGFGIGLSVVKTVMTTMGWTIDVKSKINEGTSFIITIPM